MQQTKISTLVWCALVAVPIGWSIGRVIDSVTGLLAPVPWILPLLLLFFAIIVEVGARAVHGWVTERRHDSTLDALRVARLLALAKAGEYFGAVVAGAYLGLGILALGDLAVPMGRNRALLSGLVVLGAVLVTITAVRLERACMVPRPPEENGDAGAP